MLPRFGAEMNLAQSHIFSKGSSQDFIVAGAFHVAISHVLRRFGRTACQTILVNRFGGFAGNASADYAGSVDKLAWPIPNPNDRAEEGRYIEADDARRDEHLDVIAGCPGRPYCNILALRLKELTK